jgi:hypothetical protein
MKPTKLREEITALQAVLEVSSEPVQRAMDRMVAAMERGGWQGMVDATLRRIEATKDYSKLVGIKLAVERMIKDTESSGENKPGSMLNRAPARVRQLKQLLAVLQDKMG